MAKKSKLVEIGLALALIGTIVSGFATTWTKVNPGDTVIAMSADGRIVCSVPSTAQIQISTNWGQTWFTSTNAPMWGNVSPCGTALSADGSKILASLATNFAALSWVFLSTNYGASWTKMNLPGVPLYTGYFVASSADATKQVAAARNASIYYSTNVGANWLTSSAPSTNWTSIASSADGRRMVGAVYGGKVYFSTDFGATWVPTNLPARPWNSVCVSGDGNWVGATGTNTYISRNAGVSWKTNDLAGNTVSCSANGSNWMIAGARVYTSSDGGVTWLTNLSSSRWIGAMSADGYEMIVAENTGQGMWEGRTTPSPRLNAQATNDNVTLTWLLPSTNFVLQENSDTGSGNWQPVPEVPSLNYTNLQYELVVTNSGSNGFFRLIAR